MLLINMILIVIYFQRFTCIVHRIVLACQSGGGYLVTMLATQEQRESGAFSCPSAEGVR